MERKHSPHCTTGCKKEEEGSRVPHSIMIRRPPPSDPPLKAHHFPLAFLWDQAFGTQSAGARGKTGYGLTLISY